MFEDYTYERLLEDVLDNAPEDIDTRQGSIFYDAVSGILLKVAKLYTDLDLVVDMVSVASASGEALDARAGEYGITRLAPTRAKYLAVFEGVAPRAGERFYNDGRYFTYREGEENGRTIAYFEAEAAGSGGSDIYKGTPAVPVNSIEGLISAEFGGLYENGSDAEDDESLRTRVQEKIAGPAENGNKQHYKTWCESIEGVGRARIFPLWNGPNTVKAVLIDGEGQPCSPSKAAEVQKFVDPASKGGVVTVDGRTYTVGDGLGEGAANLGAHFTAAGTLPVAVNVSFKAELAEGAAPEQARQEAAEAIGAYFKRLVLDTAEEAEIVVRVSAVGAILSGLRSILDYSDLKLNGAAANISPGEDGVPVVGEVAVS